MRLPRLRLTVRRLMAAVALAALMISGEQARRRAVDYLDRADAHATIEARLRSGLESSSLEEEVEELRREFEEIDKSPDSPGPFAAQLSADSERQLREYRAEREADRREGRQWIEWHARMKERYRRAAWRPWRAVAPEPPPDGDLSDERLRQLYGHD